MRTWKEKGAEAFNRAFHKQNTSYSRSYSQVRLGGMMRLYKPRGLRGNVGWRAALGLDLTGRLRSWKRRYRRDRLNVFDHRTVWCGVSEWPDGTATVSASAYCN